MKSIRWKNVKEAAIKWGLLGAALASIVIVTLIFLYLVREAGPFAMKPGLDALLGSTWSPSSPATPQYGILPLVTGSLLVTALATLIAVPFGVFGAIYLSEIAGRREREILKPFIELLAAVPSVVIGFFGIVVLSPVIKYVFNSWFHLRLSSGLVALTGALLLALMATPTIISVSEDAIRSVPKSFREASLALGASKMQTIWRVTVPAALSGIIAAVMLGIGRVIGETMVVLMVTGNARLLTLNPLQPVITLTGAIAAEAPESRIGGTHYSALFCIGVLLLLITLGLNLIAQRVLRHFRFEVS